MKNSILFIFLLVNIGIQAQEKYITKKGTINFEASVPSFEEVKASCTTVTSILNADKGEIAALALMKGFRFKNALMEEAVFSSMIEGATTTRVKAKEMLRKNRKPKTHSEQMILNNFKTIQFISEHKEDEISIIGESIL